MFEAPRNQSKMAESSAGPIKGWPFGRRRGLREKSESGRGSVGHIFPLTYLGGQPIRHFSVSFAHGVNETVFGPPIAIPTSKAVTKNSCFLIGVAFFAAPLLLFPPGPLSLKQPCF